MCMPPVRGSVIINDMVDLFDKAFGDDAVDWQSVVVANQKCSFADKKCTKTHKRNPDVSIDTCTMLYGRERNRVNPCLYVLQPQPVHCLDMLIVLGHVSLHFVTKILC